MGKIISLVIALGVFFLLASFRNAPWRHIAGQKPVVVNQSPFGGEPTNTGPTPATEAEMAEVVAAFKGGNIDLCSWFCTQEPHPKYRQEVVRLLEDLLQHKDVHFATSAANALKKWGDRDSIPAVQAALRQSRGINNRGWQETLIEVLGEFKGDPSAAVIVDQMILNSEVRAKGVEVLTKFDSSIERTAMRLMSLTDTDLKIAGCKVLEKIGTRLSLNVLRAAQQESFGNLQPKMSELNQEAGKAVDAITRRK